MIYFYNMIAKKFNIKKAFLLLISSLMITLSSCMPYTPTYYMDNFTIEQIEQIKDVFDISEDVKIEIISLTAQQAWRDSCIILMFFSDADNDLDFGNHLPFKLEWSKHPPIDNSYYPARQYSIVFDDKEYYFSKEAGSIIDFRVREYKPADGAGKVLYSYFYSKNINEIFNMSKKYGKKVDGLIYREKIGIM